jgi:hypothetical protein
MAEEFNNWSKLADALVTAQSQVIRKTAFDCQGHIQAEIDNQGLVDTGFMKGAIYVVTSQESTYGQGPPPPEGAYLLPEVERPSDGTTAYVAGGANYTWWQNHGTHLIPAHGFFEKGMDRGKAGMDEAMKLINQKWEEIGH